MSRLRMEGECVATECQGICLWNGVPWLADTWCVSLSTRFSSGGPCCGRNTPSHRADLKQATRRRGQCLKVSHLANSG